MANLASKSTGNIPSWDKYVKNNPLWNVNFAYELETGVNAVLVDQNEKPLQNISAKANIYIIDKNAITIGKSRYAKVKVNGRTGFLNIKNIRKPTGKNTLRDEKMALDNLNALFKQIGYPVNIVVGNHKYKNIIGAVNVDGTPKADFALIDSSKTKQIFISHKKAGGPEAFQQYGGVTEKAGQDIYNHEEVQKFMAKVVDNIKGDKLQAPMYSVVKDKKLIGMSIYGPDFGSSSFGIENVTLIGQGNPILTKIDDQTYSLDFSSHMSINPDLTHFKEGYLPVFGATFRAGRGFDFLGKRFNGARLGIYPQKLIVSRSGAIKV